MELYDGCCHVRAKLDGIVLDDIESDLRVEYLAVEELDRLVQEFAEDGFVGLAVEVDGDNDFQIESPRRKRFLVVSRRVVAYDRRGKADFGNEPEKLRVTRPLKFADVPPAVFFEFADGEIEDVIGILDVLNPCRYFCHLSFPSSLELSF